MKTRVSMVALGATLLVGTVLTTPAAAQQTYSVGTNPQGSLFYAIGAAVSKVMVDKTGKQFRVAPYGGSSTYLPLIDKGRVDFGMANGGEMAFAYLGREIFAKRANKNLRAVAATIQLYSGWAVRVKSGIKTFEELKGKRIVGNFTAGRIFHYLGAAHLAASGVSNKDFKLVPHSNFVRGINGFIEGRVDAAYIPMGSGIGKKAMASIDGGWRYLSAGGDAKASAAMNAVLPSARAGTRKPKKGVSNGIVANPTHLVVVDALLGAGKHVPDDVVYQVVKTMYNNKPNLKKAFGAFARFNPKAMMPKTPVPYHPGALKFYKEIGLLK